MTLFLLCMFHSAKHYSKHINYNWCTLLVMPIGKIKNRRSATFSFLWNYEYIFLYCMYIFIFNLLNTCLWFCYCLDRLRCTNYSRMQAPGLIISIENFRYTSMWDPKFSRNCASFDTRFSQLHDLFACFQRKWSPIDKNSTQLINPPLPWNKDRF